MIENREQKNPFTVAEAAQRLYLAQDLVVSLLERGLLEGFRAEDGNWRVLLPAARGRGEDDASGESPTQAPPRFVPHSRPQETAEARLPRHVDPNAAQWHIAQYERALAERDHQIARLVDTICNVLVKVVERTPPPGGTPATQPDGGDAQARRLDQAEERLDRHDRDIRDLCELFKLLRDHLERKREAQ